MTKFERMKILYGDGGRKRARKKEREREREPIVFSDVVDLLEIRFQIGVSTPDTFDIPLPAYITHNIYKD